MASDRDTLAELIALAGFALERDVWCASWPEDEQEAFALGQSGHALERREAVQDLRRAKLADRLIAAGGRPPAREITTAAELDALPDDSIVVDHHNAGWQMADRDYDGTAIWMYHTAARTSAELLGAGARVALVFVPIEAVSDDDQ